MKKEVYLGVATSYIYTIFYVAHRGKIVCTYYIDNLEFNNKISTILDTLISEYGEFIFINIFQGPAPLLSCRTMLTFFQAISFSLKIPIITHEGIDFYAFPFYDFVFIQNFSDTYLGLNCATREKNKFSSEEIKNFVIKKNKIGLVARRGHSLPFDYFSVILFPNTEQLAFMAWNDFLKKKMINLFDLKPFF